MANIKTLQPGYNEGLRRYHEELRLGLRKRKAKAKGMEPERTKAVTINFDDETYKIYSSFKRNDRAKAVISLLRAYAEGQRRGMDLRGLADANSGLWAAFPPVGGMSQGAHRENASVATETANTGVRGTESGPQHRYAAEIESKIQEIALLVVDGWSPINGIFASESNIGANYIYRRYDNDLFTNEGGEAATGKFIETLVEAIDFAIGLVDGCVELTLRKDGHKRRFRLTPKANAEASPV